MVVKIEGLEGKTITGASSYYSADCSSANLELQFSDGTSYIFEVDLEPVVKGIVYHSDEDDDLTETVLHEKG